jgi:hypothetical protein
MKHFSLHHLAFSAFLVTLSVCMVGIAGSADHVTGARSAHELLTHETLDVEKLAQSGSERVLIVLTDGNTVEGTIVRTSKAEVVIDTEVAGLPLRKTIARDDILKMTPVANRPSDARDSTRTPTNDQAKVSGHEDETAVDDERASTPEPTTQTPSGVPADIAAKLDALRVGFQLQAAMPTTAETKVTSVKRPGKPFMPATEKQAQEMRGAWEAVRMRLTYEGTVTAEFWIDAEDPIPLVIFEGTEADAHLYAATTQRRGKIKVRNAKSSLSTRIECDGPNAINRESLKKAHALAIQKALEGVRVYLSFDGKQVVTAKLKQKDDAFVLQPIAVAALDHHKTMYKVVTDYDASLLPHILSGLAKFQQERGGPQGTPIPLQIPAAWAGQLAGQIPKDVVVFQGCWHCGNRPNVVPPLHLQCTRCEGCQHTPGCTGDPTQCGACAQNAKLAHASSCLGGSACDCPGMISRRHCVTMAEARKYQQKFEAFIDNPEFVGSGVYTETRIDVPCENHHPRTMTQRGIERTWTMIGRVEIIGLPPDASEVVLLEGGVSESIGLRTSALSQGTLAVEAVSTVADQILTSDPSAAQTSRTLAQIKCRDGSARTPADALQNALIAIRTASGGILVYRIDAASSRLVPGSINFAAWCAARRWSAEVLEQSDKP